MKKKLLIFIIMCIFIVLYLLYHFNYIPHKKYTNNYFNIKTYVSSVDKNIDFRRVKNLKIYLDYNAISLTTDINDIENWQGGDIVVFKNHIGVVLDNRNHKGINFVIHHANPYQKYYEEDILEYHNDIVGHYRIS